MLGNLIRCNISLSGGLNAYHYFDDTTSDVTVTVQRSGTGKIQTEVQSILLVFLGDKKRHAYFWAHNSLFQEQGKAAEQSSNQRNNYENGGGGGEIAIDAGK